MSPSRSIDLNADVGEATEPDAVEAERGLLSLVTSAHVACGGHAGNEELAEIVAHQLLARWGVVTWELWGRESFKVPWREVVWALRRLEARGLALGGRFVAGLSGEQYALAEAAEDLLAVHRRPADGEEVVVAGADPLNLTGSILGGTRVPTRRHQRVVYRDGAVVDHVRAG